MGEGCGEHAGDCRLVVVKRSVRRWFQDEALFRGKGCMRGIKPSLYPHALVMLSVERRADYCDGGGCRVTEGF